MTEKQQAILAYIRQNPSVTRKEISDSIPQVTENGIKYNLARLQKLGILKRIGGRKQGHWKIIDSE